MRRIKKKVLSLFTGILAVAVLLGCKTNKLLQGTYSTTAAGPDAFTLILKPDSTFLSESYSDMMGSSSLGGKWHVKNDSLLLNFKTVPVADDFIRITVGPENKDKDMTIRVIDAGDKSPVVGAGIQVNGQPKRLMVDRSGVITDSLASVIRSVLFTYGSISKTIDISSLHTKNITIVVDFDKKPVISGAKLPGLWKIKKNKLIPFDGNGLLEWNSFLVKKE